MAGDNARLGVKRKTMIEAEDKGEGMTPEEIVMALSVVSKFTEAPPVRVTMAVGWRGQVKSMTIWW